MATFFSEIKLNWVTSSEYGSWRQNIEPSAASSPQLEEGEDKDQRIAQVPHCGT